MLEKIKKKINHRRSIAWLIGFIEAEGCFSIYKASSTYYRYTFSIVQQADIHILRYIKQTFNISSNIYHSRGCNCLTTSKTESIQTIIDILQDNLVGIKALEFHIWAYSFLIGDPAVSLAAKLGRLALRASHPATSG